MKNLKNNWLNRLIVRFLFNREAKKLKDKQLTKMFVDLFDVMKGKKQSQFPKWQVNIAFACTQKQMKKRGLTNVN